ncbi:hypothetical protein ILUMI_17848 [Ignelater luminosus]|uniref:Luciferin 4-monooxygenase n=1 Tax=Ignelater luminosus TaxID=2038154 RepID=A0A8K0CRG5_IGNLU|nr:hypothetical protein ILUMI_17848 [Ignelater luminosus]
MQKHQDKTVQIDALSGEKDTFSSLLQRCIRTAITMRSKGITPDDTVALCTFNHLNGVVPYISSIFIGAKAAALDPTLSLVDTTHLLKQVTPKIIFVVPQAIELIEKAAEEISSDVEIVVFGETEKHTKFSDFLQPKDGEDSFEPVAPKSLFDTAIILFSSGTSGMPKGICLTHYGLLGQTMSMMNLGLDHDIILAFASLYWITSALYWSICIIGGTTRLILPKFDPAVFWEIIHKFKPTCMFVAPTQVLAAYNQERPKHFKSDSLKDVFIGGGPLLKELLLQVRKAFPNTRVTLAYGQTEVSGFLSCFKPDNLKEVNAIPHKPTSTGSGIPGLTYKVVDPETEELLGPYQEGELRIKTKFQMNGYYNLDSSDAWDSDGWLKSGDIVYYDEDKCFYVVDRVKEMLKFQSWHVPPAVIENVLLTHPSIEIAVVIGVPHEIDGDHPMAVVKLRKGCVEGVTSDDIEKYVEERVHDRQRLRGGVKIVDFIPTTPTGKVKRKEVKKMILCK